ncbi:hypothetical protein [Ruminococcus sp.]|uniref:hypothetical protein n=1 Tax=Ruminococcus sp. TaxID=41978 RepID=UPI0025CEA35E|nr:hypothetical protein [Ruminococcus sp.]
MGTVPKSTKADVKLVMGLSAQRIAICIVVGLISFSICQEFITNSILQVAVSIIFIIISLILSGKSPTNPQITFAKGLILFVFHFLEPKTFYGQDTDEYRLYKEKEAKKNVKKKSCKD